MQMMVYKLFIIILLQFLSVQTRAEIAECESLQPLIDLSQISYLDKAFYQVQEHNDELVRVSAAIKTSLKSFAWNALVVFFNNPNNAARLIGDRNRVISQSGNKVSLETKVGIGFLSTTLGYFATLNVDQENKKITIVTDKFDKVFDSAIVEIQIVTNDNEHFLEISTDVLVKKSTLNKISQTGLNPIDIIKERLTGRLEKVSSLIEREIE